MMPLSVLRRGLLRGAAYSLFCVLLCFAGARGDAQERELRIGLQTGQTTVRLSSPAPVRVTQGEQPPLDLPAEQVLTFTMQGKALTLGDAGGHPLLSGEGAMRVAPSLPTTPAVVPAAAAPATTAPDTAVLPVIRLLGPTRHYDGKPDRPYRGVMELLPRPEGVTVVNIVEIESYLQGVVSSEMSPNFPVEALKAQAVAARTYALKNVGRLAAQGFDLDDTPGCQVYGGLLSEDPRTTQAVHDTAGQVLTYNGKLIDAVYSSTCGGFSESAAEAWGHTVPYLVSVPDFSDEMSAGTPYPKDETGWSSFFKATRNLNCLQPKYARPDTFRWVKVLTRKDLEAGLPAADQVGMVRDITPLRRGASGRIYALRITGTERTVTLNDEGPIRRAFGSLRSSAFTVDIYRDDAGTPVVFIFWGAGWGHGIGMCQVGAVGLAEQGWSYDKILTHYYQGVKIEKL